MPRMSWRSVSICILSVTLSACATKSSPQPSGTVGTAGTAAPVTTSTPTTVVTTTAVEPSTTAPAPTTSDLGPGPSDAEIQAILNVRNSNAAKIFGDYKRSLVITPAIDDMIVQAFGPVAQDMRDALTGHGAVQGRLIREHPQPPKSVVREVVSRSDNCFVVLIDYDAGPMIDTSPEQRNELYRFVASHWYPYGGVLEDQMYLFRNRPCDVQ